MQYFPYGGRLRRTLRAGLLAAAQLLLVGPALAAQVILTDETGAPLANAVLLVDGVPSLPADGYVMDQIDRQFVPHVLAAPVGAEVDFPNSDDVRHHVYSFSETKPFELRLFKGSEAPPVIFDRAGVVVLGCNIHDAMLGYILITESPRFAVSDAQGRVSLPELPPGKWPVSWWHSSRLQKGPVSLGELDLGQEQTLSLPVSAAQARPVPMLSPLQQRFKSGY